MHVPEHMRTRTGASTIPVIPRVLQSPANCPSSATAWMAHVCGWSVTGRYVLERELGRGGVATAHLIPGSFTQRRD